jgi:hypothetical protein
LPGLPRLRGSLNLPSGTIPRKGTPTYATALIKIIESAHKISKKKDKIDQLLYIGDTRANDETAFYNLCQRSGWQGAAFIAAETDDRPHTEVIKTNNGEVLLSNRWSVLAEFDSFCRGEGIPIDEHTAVIIDIDKTTLGARGRNDQVIDGVRLEAMKHTIRELLGKYADEDAFSSSYNELNQPQFHRFTTDNQDYLAYTCLILTSGIIGQDALLKAIKNGKLAKFSHLLAWVEERNQRLPLRLRQVHHKVRAAISQGSPTPFLEFRRNEYKITADKMGCLADDAPLKKLLEQEIVITHEVANSALRWRGLGACLFGVSDKPDEASLPTEELIAEGYSPIHSIKTHVIGD